MTIDRVLSIIAITVSFIAVPASGYLTYRFTIKSEKRKEFNLVAEPIMISLLEQIDSINDGYPPYTKLKTSEIHRLVSVSGKKRGTQIIADFKAYEKAIADSGSSDEWHRFTYYSEESRSALLSAIEQFAKNVDRR